MENRGTESRADELKIVSRPSNEELEEEVEDQPKRKWKKFPTSGAASETELNERASVSNSLTSKNAKH